jgi:glycosyltransferase involved in cell wall biosynthesis
MSRGRHRVVMVATSYPRFPGDTVGTFMEPIATGVAARGHEVHMVLPWHPRLERRGTENGVTFHAFHYAPAATLHVFGYAGALREDVRLRPAAIATAPLALASGWRLARKVARQVDATVMHGHWLVPGGALAAWAAPDRPLVISLHGSDVYVAERHVLARHVASRVLSRAAAVVACSDDLRIRALALGAAAERSLTVPYGVDAERFRPDPVARTRQRATWGVADDEFVVFSAGRFVRKKGFEYLIDAVGRLRRDAPRLRLVLAGGGDLDGELRARLEGAGVEGASVLPGLVPHAAMPAALAAADLVVVPSVRDDAGNVDGLPNVVLEALASGTPVVATTAGGIGAAIEDDWTGRLVPERDVEALARAIAALMADRGRRVRYGVAARTRMVVDGTWARVAERLEAIYDEACCGAKSARAIVSPSTRSG